VFARYEKGEFPSVRAAAREAGIIKEDPHGAPGGAGRASAALAVAGGPELVAGFLTPSRAICRVAGARERFSRRREISIPGKPHGEELNFGGAAKIYHGHTWQRRRRGGPASRRGNACAGIGRARRGRFRDRPRAAPVARQAARGGASAASAVPGHGTARGLPDPPPAPAGGPQATAGNVGARGPPCST
jgi:hypothetical protein